MSTQVSSAADEVAIAVQTPAVAAAGTVAGELAKMSPPPPLSSLVASLFGSVKNNENQPQIRSNAGCSSNNNNNNNNNNKRSLSNGSVNGANTSNGGTPRKLDKQQFGMCKICNDKATGIHYGIPSCEGCKVSLSGA